MFLRAVRPLICVVVFASFAVLGSGCGPERSTYDVSWLLGASSTFEVTTEGLVNGSLAGTATFRTDEAGRLVGIELVHIDDSTRGISMELEPRPTAARTYEVIDPSLLAVERPGSTAGFTAFFESSAHSFVAARGTLQITQADASAVYGTFEIEMEGQGQATAESGVTVDGTFQATRRDE